MKRNEANGKSWLSKATSAGLALTCCVGAVATVSAGVPTSAAGGKPNRDSYVSAWGVRVEDYRWDFRSDGELRVGQTDTSVPCNMAYAGEVVKTTVQLRNESADALKVRGHFLLMDYTFVTCGDDVFALEVRGGKGVTFGAVACQLPAGGSEDVVAELPMPERFGTYALFFEREDNGVRLFVGSFARILRAALEPHQSEYAVCMDLDDPDAIQRLRTPANRIGVPYVPSDRSDCEREYARIAEKLRRIGETGYPVCVEFGAGPDRGDYLPLGRIRPHLTDDGVMLETKSDFAWLPSYDADFAERVKWVVRNFGYPKGPVNALMLWNEPWAGLSISGWGADDLRYREMYEVMCRAAEEAMAETPGVKVLLGGTDSSSNTFDKLFGDGDMKFLKWLDFMSLHYQGLAPSNPRFLRDRVHPNGRTRFWDTESWVANSPDRVPAVLAAMLAAGHDRLVGIQGNAVVGHPMETKVRRPDGTEEARKLLQAWPAAPALAAFQHFVGNRKFRGVAWKGLPWLFEFRGEAEEDLTYVICGDIGPAIDGHQRIGEVPFWTVRGHGESLTGTLTLADGTGLTCADACGNVILRGEPGKPLTLVLDDTGTYLRADGSPGSAARLRRQLAESRIEGMPRVVPTLRDSTLSIGGGALFTASLFNPLNRAVSGKVQIEMPGLELAYDRSVTIRPQETVELPIRVVGGRANAANLYPCRLEFRPEDGPPQILAESLRVNRIAGLTPRIDGVIDGEWSGALAQRVTKGMGGATMMEKAWMPMVAHGADTEPEDPSEAFANVFFSADENFFYVAARVKDDTPDEGMQRFETRDEDADFYPDESIEYDGERTLATREQEFSVRGGAVAKAWSPLVKRIAFDVNPGPDGACVTLSFADNDGMFRRDVRVTVEEERGEGKSRQARYGVRTASAYSRVRFNLRARARVIVEQRNWLKPLLTGVAFDPYERDLKDGATESSETREFPRQCGALARAVPGATQEAAERFGFAWVEEVSRVVHRWPAGVRHFSYRRFPEMPCGLGHDCFQLAFNVLDDAQKKWYPSAPGMFKGYSGYCDSDYEFSCYAVAEKFGGGTEIWKCRAPSLPDKHYFPHGPKHPDEGPVKGGRLVVNRTRESIVYEAAIPWSEIPEVRSAREAGRPIKLSCRVSDNRDKATAELAYRRSVSKRNVSFKPDWVEHWANEVEFVFER